MDNDNLANSSLINKSREFRDEEVRKGVTPEQDGWMIVFNIIFLPIFFMLGFIIYLFFQFLILLGVILISLFRVLNFISPIQIIITRKDNDIYHN